MWKTTLKKFTCVSAGCLPQDQEKPSTIVTSTHGWWILSGRADSLATIFALALVSIHNNDLDKLIKEQAWIREGYKCWMASNPKRAKRIAN